MTEGPPPKSTYRELCYNQNATLLDIWQGGTKLDDNTLLLLWNHYPIPQTMAQLALDEYNDIFRTRYTLDQVDIPTMEAFLAEERQRLQEEGEQQL